MEYFTRNTGAHKIGTSFHQLNCCVDRVFFGSKKFDTLHRFSTWIFRLRSGSPYTDQSPSSGARHAVKLSSIDDTPELYRVLPSFRPVRFKSAVHTSQSMWNTTPKTANQLTRRARDQPVVSALGAHTFFSPHFIMEHYGLRALPSVSFFVIPTALLNRHVFFSRKGRNGLVDFGSCRSERERNRMSEGIINKGSQV